MTLKLYSTEGCHLCELAFGLISELNLGLKVEIVDIAFDDKLFERYGVTIPVLSYGASELGWPFDSIQLQQWLENNGITHNS
ncbi:glutaredoxin family protein [Vibrio sp. S4M6]|uniref:glutaredoxin family protein n=1 Tax=Vibrio sinus TaxID=2946865 RepID=UPI00202A1C7A|nr:glutaredoxin family protein [Vibrio sinus]MCL9783109.1 glutaredoxin family protein [Vibrio sinus]